MPNAIGSVKSWWRNARVHFYGHVANGWLRVRQYGAAAAAYERILRILPDNPWAQFQRAWSLLHIPNRRVEAIVGFQTVLPRSPSAGGYYLLAWGLQQEGRDAEAVNAFTEALRLDSPGPPDFYRDYAHSLRAVGRLEDAAESFRCAAQLNPADAEAWGNFGAALADLGRWKDAAPCQERAMRIAPSVIGGLNFAETLYELNRCEDAEHVLRDVLALDARCVDAKELLALALAGQERYDEAIALAREIHAANPTALSSLEVMAGVLTEAGRLEEALEHAKAAAVVAPDDARSHAGLGCVWLAMKDGAAALAAVERVAELLPAEPNPLPSSPWKNYLAARAIALSLLARHEEAVETFEKMLVIDRDFFERWPDMMSHYEESSRAIGKSAATTP